MDLSVLEKLCATSGVSGNEHRVSEMILSQIEGFATSVETDSLGNILAFKKGACRAKRKLLLSAHTDEVGFIVTGITDKGFLKFSTVGGIDNKVILGKLVSVGHNKIPGIIGVKPVHLLGSDEKQATVKPENLCIDIGAKDKADAENFVTPGDSVCFTTDFYRNGNTIMAKALDDRAGCFILINMIKQDLPVDMYFSFVTQEEVGLRGARVAAFSINPDCAIVVESTTADDTSLSDDIPPVCKVGSGAVISFMDSGTIYDKEYYDMAFSLAKLNDLKAQPKRSTSGGNDAGAIHTSRGGVRTIAVSLPCRYLHSAVSLVSAEDMESVQNLTLALASKIAGV